MIPIDTVKKGILYSNKFISVFCVLLAVTLLFCNLPLVQANTTKTAPKYGESFLFCVENAPPIPQTPTDAPTTVLLGDVNGDTKINAKDVFLVLKYAVGKIQLTQEQIQGGEVNGDGFINAKDALEILKYSVEKTS